ncbi:chromosome partitioning protein ParA [Vibrio sp. CAU 1672]|uniref:chromosome partitioning protein ParA n=1 Tax=Vibrio sp. CAU 1672 TaxID=3032594 RepID=UPI0023D9B4E9|nr:chromosome partitioning protein ParA [Vibrio sp. CAU 1672]MDF2154050.1 chromosome partitioning protein ParA [Vibrio sp. CAU 1672]
MYSRLVAIGLAALLTAPTWAADSISAPITPEATSTIKQGYFIDSPVTGLYYQTSSNLSGFTQKGAFQYQPGDVISFFLGNDDQGYLLTTLSSQEVLTPTMATTKPSRSINMTRLLLSLDSTPENRQEIILANKVLSDPRFQAQLKSLDLNYLDDAKHHLNLDWVSVDEALKHLNESQQYIEKNFASDEVIFQPRNIRFKNIIIKKKDWQGRACAFDIRYQHHPRYRPPIGEINFTITDDTLIEHPGIGDYFQGCFLSPKHRVTEEFIEPIEKFSEWKSLIGCSLTGCTRSDLNGFSLEDYDDEGDWKYRSVALNFDPTTQLLMEKVQGLGQNEHIRHSNRTEMLWFTYPDSTSTDIDYQGIWQQTRYHQQSMTQTCLWMDHQRVLRLPGQTSTCPTDTSLYTQDVTTDYADMWWINNQHPKAELAQMNVMVRWSPTPEQINYTTWEYLPAGKTWEQGILYRYQQHISRNRDGSDRIETHTISEFVKVNEDV